MQRLTHMFRRSWLPLYMLLSVSWLFAPWVHRVHTGQLSVISSYEAGGQPWSWLFRFCDILAAVLLLLATAIFRIRQQNKVYGTVLYVLGGLAVIDGIFAIGCTGMTCSAWQTLVHVIHDGESLVSIGLLGLFCLLDVVKRRRLPSVVLLALQVAIAGAGVSSLMSHQQLVASQFVYEVALAAWLAWIVYGFAPATSPAKHPLLVRRLVGWLALGMGILLILQAFRIDIDIPFLRTHIFPHQAWLTQHGVITGVLFLYISRHIFAGQRRAATLVVALCALLVFRYSIVAPQPVLLAIYIVAAVLVALAGPSFDRNSIASSFESRLRDIGVVLAGIVAAATILYIAASFAGQGPRLRQTFERVYISSESRTDKVTRRNDFRFRQASTVLLASTVAVVAWSFFRPAGKKITDYASAEEQERAAALLAGYSTSSEDFFKLWPADKSYYFTADGEAFVAYKVAASTVFVLADAIGTAVGRQAVLVEALGYFRRQGWSVCFLGITPDSRLVYETAGLKTVAIGSSAVISVETFASETMRNKWWRWQLNRASRNGLSYTQATAPHDPALIAEVTDVSNAWLARAGHQEQSFALGYYDAAYMQQCTLHCLRDATGKLVAFSNQLPSYNAATQATVDLIRFRPDVDGAMPVLIANIVVNLHEAGQFRTFDLGFVPLAKLDSKLALIARRLMARRYSAAGLEQFKDKFEPDWQKTYLAYENDVVELGKAAAAIEKVLRLP